MLKSALEFLINFRIPVILLFIHLIADFFLQFDWMALNKSKDFQALYAHVLVYSLCFIFWGPWFVLVTFATHFLTDGITSRITSKLWFIDLHPRYNPEKKPWVYPFLARVKVKKRHWFFVVIGIDQFIHVVTLGLTWRLFYGL